MSVVYVSIVTLCPFSTTFSITISAPHWSSHCLLILSISIMQNHRIFACAIHYLMNVTEIESNAIKWEINTKCDFIHKITTYIGTKAHFVGFYSESNDNDAVTRQKKITCDSWKSEWKLRTAKLINTFLWNIKSHSQTKIFCWDLNCCAGKKVCRRFHSTLESSILSFFHRKFGRKRGRYWTRSSSVLDWIKK